MSNAKGTKRVKLSRSTLKEAVRECFVELIVEDPQFARDIIVDSLMTLFEATGDGRRAGSVNVVDERRGAGGMKGSNLRESQASRATSRATSRVRSRAGRVSSSSPVDGVSKTRARAPVTSRDARDADVGDDMFEQLVADTLERTLPAQLQEDARRQLMYDSESSWEEGPAARLAAAQTQQHVSDDDEHDIRNMHAERHLSESTSMPTSTSMYDDLSYDQLAALARRSMKDNNTRRSADEIAADVDEPPDDTSWLDQLAP